MKRLTAAISTALVLGTSGIAIAQNVPTVPPNVCVQNAIETRDTAIIARFDAYYTTARAALTVRKDGLKTAWNTTDKDQRKLQIKTVGKTYKEAIKTSRRAFRDGRRDLWDAYKDAVRLCDVRGSEKNEGQGADNSL